MGQITTGFTSILPNPNNSISYAGDDGSQAVRGVSTGPGYSNVKVTSKFQTMMNETNSGTLITRSKASQSFEVSISYNPLTEEEFNVLYAFLLEKQGMLKPFFVTLPQYEDTADLTLAGKSPEVVFSATQDYNPGTTQMTIDGTNYNSNTDSQLRPGDMFIIEDPSDTNHTKAYKITRVETFTDYFGTQPANNENRISFSPPLRRKVFNNAVIRYKNPLLKVIQSSDSINYSLRTNGLYTFSLKVKEVQ